MEILCFDMDNTLIYGTRMHLEAFKLSFKKNKLQKKTKKEMLKYFSLNGKEYVHRLFPELTKKQVVQVVKDHDYYVFKKTAKLVKPIPGAKATLKKLKPHYKIAILSNCKHAIILSSLKHAKFDKSMFDLIIGYDEVKHGKPAPDELFKAERLLKIKKGYMVGDSIYDIQAANKAGLKGVAVLTGHNSRYQMQKEKPWKILNSVKDLPKLLLK